MSEVNIPEVELDTFEDAIQIIMSRSATVLCNILDIEKLNTKFVEMHPKHGEIPYDPSIPPEDALNPHMMVHLCHNSRMHKMYCEFSFDNLMLNYLRSTSVYSEFRDKLCKKVYNEYEDAMGLNERIFMVRPRKYCPKEYGTSNLINIGTVGRWTSMEGKKEFLHDNIETELAFTQYKMKNLDSEQAYFRKLEEHVEEIHQINVQLEDEIFTFDEAFEVYKDYFNEQFKDEYIKINPSTGVEETKYYYPLYEFYEKSYYIYFYDLIPEPEDEE